LKTLAPGTLVGKYPVVRVMSTGGMGVIYEAAHPVLGTRVVIKTVLPTMAGNVALAERFRNEAMAASRIRDELGWEPRETFETGIAKTVEWYLGNEAWWRPLVEAKAAERRGIAA